MREISIEIRDLKKYYAISQKKGFSFVDLPDIVKNTRSKHDPIKKVLDGINLDIYKGECFGIIGPNGTGKSTLLRLISGIIPPDSGSVKIHGSLIPLLSLGVGFSDELNAHDNIYQYGMILGFSRKEMDDLYDDIIAFSGLEQYQYMLLRNYSSGMRVRLAFTTAVQINPDILVLDEVLSVGDLSFKEKSQRKILDFCNSDKTVVIVSHSMSTITDLCDRAMFLKDGKICRIGDPYDVINAYMVMMQEYITPKDLAFTGGLAQERANQEKDQNYVHRVINRVSELHISPLIRSHYNLDTERSLNEYLTWENLKKTPYLEEVLQISSDEHSRGKANVGVSVVSFLKKLGDQSESRAIASMIINNLCKDGFICIGNDNLTDFFNGKPHTDELPPRIATMLICEDSRAIPVIFDIKEAKKIDHRSVFPILEKAHCEPGSETTLVISPELYNHKGIASLKEHSIQFLAPVQVREIEEGNFDPAFFEEIVSPDNMMIFNDRLVFAKKGQFENKGIVIDGYGYFDPRRLPPDYNGYYRKMDLLRNVFEKTKAIPSKTPDVLIRDIAKWDAIYFSGTKNADLMKISFNYEAVFKRQKLMGTLLVYHSGTWDAEMCFRNHEIWMMTEQSFNFYRQVLTLDDPLLRGKALLSLINNAVSIGII